VLLLPGTHEWSFVHGQVVQDDMNDFSPMSANGLVQEFNELSAGVPRAQRPSSFTLSTSSAANRETVQWRTYSTARRSTWPQRIG
jgi:hypothetical protein